MAGSYYVENLTDEVENAAWNYIKQIDAMGGSVAAIEEGFMQKEIAAAAYKYQDAVEKEEEILVGVNKFTVEEEGREEILKVDDAIRNAQIEKIAALKAERDNAKVEEALSKLKTAAEGEDNLMPFILEAVESYATLGEIADELRGVFGEY